MGTDSIYDSIFKTMTQKMPFLLIPLANYAFGTSYPEDARISRMGEEYEGRIKKRIADSVFRIGETTFHIECQSSWDPHMAMRMDRYDREIAHEEADARHEHHLLKLPHSCVIFLRDAQRMQPFLSIEIGEPCGETSEHRTAVIWVKQIDLEEMLEHRLFILLPFWFMRYEGSFEAAARDSALAEQLLAECRTLQMRFAEVLHANVSEQSPAEDTEGSSTFQRRMTELIIKVSDHLLRGYEPLQREVREAMGVKILKFADERYAEREQKAREESHKQGLEQGLEQGHKQGLQQGAELERRRLADSLRSRGFDESTIDEVLSFGRKDGGGEGPAVQHARFTAGIPS